MKIKPLGMILIAVGIIMIIYTGFNYVTAENVVDIGPLHIEKDTVHPIHWSPVIGVVCLSIGILIMITGKRGLVK